MAIKNLFNKFDLIEKRTEIKKIPKHIAIVVEGILEWSKENKKDIKESLELSKKKLYDIIINQTVNNIPIITIYIKTEEIKNQKDKDEITKSLCDFLGELKKDNNIHKNKVKVSILGKWYNLPSSFIDEIKKLIDETKEYDSFFLNLCLNYDGQEEIVDACKIITKKIEARLVNVNEISKEMIKENIYSSYFLPPDLIIVTGKKSTTHGLLLWDSSNSSIYFSKLLWPDFSKESFIKALNFFEKE